MGRINSIEKITSNLVNNIQNASLKAVQGEIENTVRFFIGTVVNLDSLNGRAKVRYMSVENNDYTDIECAIKTEELIKINDIVIVLYIRNLANAFIFAKMTSNYYSKSTKASNDYTDIALSKYVTLSTNQNIIGAKTFEAETTTFNQIIAFTNKTNPYIRFESTDSSNPNLTPTSYYVQGYENKLAVGPSVGGGTATVWDKNGNIYTPQALYSSTISGNNIITKGTYDYVTSSSFSSTSGYIKYNSGLIIQWGKETWNRTNVNVTKDVIFPISFETADFMVNATVIDSSTNNYHITCPIVHSTAIDSGGHGTGVKIGTYVVNNASYSTGMYYIAIGK